MKTKLFLSLGILLIALSVTGISLPGATTSNLASPPALPLQNNFPYFAPNTMETQFTALNDKFQARFESGRVILALTSGETITITFQGSDETCIPIGQAPVAAKAHYYQGNTPHQWRENVPLYTELRYKDLYPGIDLLYAFINGRLKSEFIIHPGATLEKIHTHYAGIQELSLQDDIMHIVVNDATILDEVIPYTYESYEGMQREVTARFHYIDSHSHGFRIADTLNPAATLTIDPELRYATYFGGTAADEGWAVAADYEGNSYITGITFSPDLPVSDSTFPPPLEGTRDIFIAKFDIRGNLVYATYYGGSGNEKCKTIAADPTGNAYVTGQTFSKDLPLKNAWQPSYFGNTDSTYVLKLDPQGHMEWGTYIGEGGESNAIAVDQLGRVYIVGDVYRDDFPLLNPWCSVTYGENDEDGFISVFDPDGQLIYSTYVSGPNRDQLYAIAVDDRGHVYVAGMTSSPAFPVHNAVQSVYGGGWEDCLIFKLDPWNNELHFATFLGGLDREACLGIDFDQERNIYVTGYTSSPNFPTINAHQTTKKAVGISDTDAFVARLSPSGTVLQYATYLGGSNANRGWDIVADHRGYTYIVGHTESLDFPIRNALQPSHGGGVRDGFVAIFDPNGVLQYASYLGGAGYEILRGVALDGNWIAHIAGETSSEQMATDGAFQPQYTGTGTVDALLARFAFIPTPTPTPTPTPYVSAEIGPEGGAMWLSYPEHLTLLQVPPGALDNPTTFELVYDNRPDAQGDLQGLNHFFRLAIDPAQNVIQPLLLTLGYQETRGVIAETIAPYRLEGNTWVTSGITVAAQSTLLMDQSIAWIKVPGIYGLLGETRRLYVPLILRY